MNFLFLYKNGISYQILNTQFFIKREGGETGGE